MKSPYQVTADLEAALCEYTGSPFAVAVNSCTAALMLAVQWNLRRHTFSDFGCLPKYGREVEIPKRTYVSVPMAIVHAGGQTTFRDEEWRGSYQLKPLPVWDCARRFTSGMYVAGQFQCVSFATTKILGIEQGGAILCDNKKAYERFKKMRFDGRTEGVDPSEDRFDFIGHHCIMLPSIAAQLLLKLHHLPKHNEDLSPYPYPDLSKHLAFR